MLQVKDGNLVEKNKQTKKSTMQTNYILLPTQQRKGKGKRMSFDFKRGVKEFFKNPLNVL